MYDWKIPSGNPDFCGKLEIVRISIPIAILIWVYDISDDAESRFSEREAGWEESQRVVCYKDCELACEAVYKNRAGKPRNFL